MRLEMAASLRGLSLGGGGQTRLSIMSSVEFFTRFARSGGSAMRWKDVYQSVGKSNLWRLFIYILNQIS